MASWLVARWFLGGELVGGEIPWWRGDRIPIVVILMPSMAVAGCLILLQVQAIFYDG